jgi:proteasome activator subunit 4
MHLYNAWLPPPVVEETKKEKDSFRTVLNSVKNSYKPDDPDSVYSTLKWISVLELLVSPPLSLSISLITIEFSALFDSNGVLMITYSFIKAKSELNLEDVAELVQFGIELFNISQNKLYAQVLL